MPKAKKTIIVKTSPTLTIDRKALVQGLATVTPVFSTRSCLPILSFVLAKWGNGKMDLTATDLTTAITCSVPMEGGGSGEVAFPGALVLKIIEKFSADTVQITVDNKQIMHLICEEAKYNFACMSPDEFPVTPEIKAESVEVDEAVLRKALRGTAFAAGTDGSRAILEGTFLNLPNQVAVCTNGRMLAQCSDLPNEKAPEIVIPALTVTRLIFLLTGESKVAMAVGENKASFSFRETKVVSNLIEGAFPNYKQVIPKESKNKAVVDVPSFLEVLNRVALVSSSTHPTVKLEFNANQLSFSTVNADVGNAAEFVGIKYTGDKLKMAFDPAMLLDVFGYLHEGEATMAFTDELSPLVVKSGAFLYVIMPMRLN